MEISEADAYKGLYAAFKSVVEYRHNKLLPDIETKSHILQAARWLINPYGTFGLLLCGLCGNGKTTLATAIGWLIRYVTKKEYGFNNHIDVPLYTTKEVCELCCASEKSKENKSQYTKLFKESIIILDDLGEEPKEVMVYGMIHTPVLDLICKRYSEQRMTIITTNLDTDQLKEKYGMRIYDRFREMLTPIIFENDSYRRPKKNGA